MQKLTIKCLSFFFVNKINQMHRTKILSPRLQFEAKTCRELTVKIFFRIKIVWWAIIYLFSLIFTLRKQDCFYPEIIKSPCEFQPNFLLRTDDAFAVNIEGSSEHCWSENIAASILCWKCWELRSSDFRVVSVSAARLAWFCVFLALSCGIELGKQTNLLAFELHEGCILLSAMQPRILAARFDITFAF